MIAVLPSIFSAHAELRVAVLAADPVRRAGLAARVALAGHVLAEGDADADVVLGDAEVEATSERPMLRLDERGLDERGLDERGLDERGEDGVNLPSELTPAQLNAALRAVAVGLRVSLPALPRGFGEAEPTRPLLTPREVEILACLGEGLSNKAVARRLGISAHTVKFHLEAVFAKLGATSRAEAVAKGLRRGLILL